MDRDYRRKIFITLLAIVSFLSIAAMAEVIRGDTPSLNGLDTTDPHIAEITSLDLSRYSEDDTSNLAAIQMRYNMTNSSISPTTKKTPLHWHGLMREAQSLSDRDDYDRAEVLLKNAIVLARDEQPVAYSKCIKSLNELAILYSKTSKYDKAYLISEQALRIAKSKLGSEDRLYASSLATQAYIYSYSGQYKKALKYYEDALYIYRYKFALENSSKVAYIYLNIADIYQKQKKYKKAIEIADKAIALIIELYGEKSSKLLQAYIKEAELYSDISQDDVAMIYYKKSVDLLKSIEKETPRGRYKLFKSLTEFYVKIKNYDKAELVVHNYIKISKKLYGDSNAKTLTAQKMLSSIEKHIKERESYIVTTKEMNATVLPKQEEKSMKKKEKTIKLENVNKKVEELEKNLNFVIQGQY